MISTVDEEKAEAAVAQSIMLIKSAGYPDVELYKKKLRIAVSWETYCETKEMGESDLSTKADKVVTCDCCGHPDANKLVDDLFADHMNFLCMSCYIQFIVKADSIKTKALMLEWHMTGHYPNPWGTNE